jgi:cellulose synthase/poly-beta-1,6-N-acetylglucosamine synthase-like glycosyltransferase
MTRSPLLAPAIGALAGVAAVGHALYPAWLFLTSSGESPQPPEPAEWPGVTVVVPAYLERGVIAAKVENLEQNGYEGPLEIVVVASDPDTAEAAGKTAARVIASPDRLAKPEALNRGVAAASHEVVVLTDANAMFRPGAIASLVRWFSLPGVDAVAGEKMITGEREETFYWRFESWLKDREWQKGSTIGVDGALVAVRTSAYRPMPSEVAIDDVWLALDVVEGGSRIAYDRYARVEEDPPPTNTIDWERRTRVVACTLDVLWRRRALLRPGASEVTPMLWGHRVVRSSFGPAAHLLLLLLAARSARTSRLARLFLGGHAAAGLALARTRSGSATTFVERLGGHVLYLQAVGLVGTVRFLAGEGSAHWRKVER